MTKLLRNRKTGAEFPWSKILSEHEDMELVEPEPEATLDELEVAIPKRAKKPYWRKVLHEKAKEL